MLGQRVNNFPCCGIKGDYILFDPASEAKVLWDKGGLFNL
jgi:hypothetical protein